VNYLDDLNSNQKKAVEICDGPLLVIAGAGTGKTKLLTYRILHLIKQGVDPSSILAVTFTNKAAAEMNARLNSLLELHAPELSRRSGEYARPFMSTFHALGVHILRNHAEAARRTKYFSILDRDDVMGKIKKAMEMTGVSKEQFEPKKILYAISREKGQGKNVGTYSQNTDNFWAETVATVWTTYEKLLKESNAFDFDDLLLKTVSLLAQNENIRKIYQNRWSHLHVDEYQDTNTVQYSIIKQLINPTANVCVVGDIDQSIYSWRGADFTNIFLFEEDFPQTKTIVLEQNYRSTDTILKAANEIIEKNSNRKEKNLFTENGVGDKITVYTGLDEKDEARFIAETAKDLIGRDTPAEEIAILYRANFQSRAIEEIFLKYNLPYQVLGVKFFDRKEVKDLLSYIKATTNESDFDSINRVINNPKRGIGKVTVAKIAAGLRDTLPLSTAVKVNDFYKILADIREVIATKNTAEIIKFTIKRSGLELDLMAQKEEGLERLDNLKELVTLVSKYDHLSGEEGVFALLEEAALVSDQDNLKEDKKGIRLMTVHASKGLEFDTVFVAGLEQGLFPHGGFGESDRDEEEERRLFYVAVTRARRRLYLSHTQMRTIFGKQEVNSPSEFIADIPEELIEGEIKPDGPSYEYLLDF